MPVACIGECMIELSQLDLIGGHSRIAFAGDTLNTAVYLARLRPGVSYLTNLGRDAFSTRMLAMFADEGIDCGLIGRHDTRLPGLYLIEVDAAGERSFRYWRETSAARTLFSGIGPGLADLARFEVIYLSGITLAILSAEVRAALIRRLAELKAAGHRIVFDSNYRPDFGRTKPPQEPPLMPCGWPVRWPCRRLTMRKSCIRGSARVRCWTGSQVLGWLRSC